MITNTGNLLIINMSFIEDIVFIHVILIEVKYKFKMQWTLTLPRHLALTNFYVASEMLNNAVSFFCVLIVSFGVFLYVHSFFKINLSLSFLLLLYFHSLTVLSLHFHKCLCFINVNISLLG